LYFNNCSNYSAQSGGRGQSQTIFVRGFDKNLGEDEVILSPLLALAQLCCVHSSMVLLIVLLWLHSFVVKLLFCYLFSDKIKIGTAFWLLWGSYKSVNPQRF
jgi:hypothetical protein